VGKLGGQSSVLERICPKGGEVATIIGGAARTHGGRETQSPTRKKKKINFYSGEMENDTRIHIGNGERRTLFKSP